jgi:hypothetical protein
MVHFIVIGQTTCLYLDLALVAISINLILGCKIFIDRKCQICPPISVSSHGSTIFISYPFNSSEGNGKR